MNDREESRERQKAQGRHRRLRFFVPPAEQNRRFGDSEDRGRLIRARILALLTMLSGGLYIIWAFQVYDRRHWVAGSLFLLAETACLGLFLLAGTNVWRLRFKPKEGIPPEEPYSVDLFIPVCGEPLHILKSSFEAATGIRWTGRLKVYVLDEQNSVGVRDLARRMGFVYRSRRAEGLPNLDAKAGNLNFGMSKSSGDLILTLDSDHVARPEILQVLAGYLRFPKVAFVQSQQSFLVPEGDPFFCSDHVFYDAVQLGNDHNDSVISCGSGVLYRREALEEIGGFASWNLVEDLTTSYELHSRGWKSIYYSHPVTIGLAPTDIWGVYRQRGQWALDTMRLFFWDNPLFKKGLRWSGRLSYLTIGVSYLCAAFVFPFFFVLPIWTYLTGGFILTGSEVEFLLIRLLYFAFMVAALRQLFRKRGSGRQFQMLVGLFPVYLIAAFRALFYPPGRKPPYRTNNSDDGSKKGKPHRLVAVLPQLFLLVANAVLPFYAILWQTAPPRVILSSIFVSALAIWSLSAVVFATYAKVEWGRQSPRSVYGQPETA